MVRKIIGDLDVDGDLSIAGSSTGIGIIPVGGVIAWLKSLTGTPTLPNNFVECNGQTLNDPDSPYDGQVIPDLNGSVGTQRFLRGSTTSGSTGGSETHTHTLASTFPEVPDTGGSQHPPSNNSCSTENHLPPYYEVVWIMRIK